MKPVIGFGVRKFNVALSLKKREAHRGAKGPEARGASLEAKAHASRTRGALLLKKIKNTTNYSENILCPNKSYITSVE